LLNAVPEGLASLALLGVIYGVGGVCHYWNQRDSQAIKYVIAFFLTASILLALALWYILRRWSPLF
jgi:hypothetical protein